MIRLRVWSKARASRFLAAGVVSLTMVAAACSPAEDVDGERSTGATEAVGDSSPAGGAAGEAQSGGDLVVVFPRDMTDDLPSLDPQLGAGTYIHTVLNHLYDTLVVQHPQTGEMVPWLAESWEISEDGTQYTFKLREDVTFHDGTPLNAEAVKFTFDRAASEELLPESSSVNRRMVGYVGTEVVDEYTVRMTLEEPLANFLSGTVARSVLGIVSPTAVEEAGVPAFGLESPVGTGGFMFEEWIPGDHLSLIRNPDYAWAPEFFENQGAPYVDRLVFRYISEPSTRTAALFSGEAHIIEAVPPDDQPRIEEDPRFEIFQAQKNGTPARFEVNLSRPPTDDIAVRRALNMAIDQETLNEVVFNGAHEPAYTVFEKLMLCHDDSIRFPAYDPEQARQVLEEAGWQLQDDGIRARDGEPLVVEAITTSETVPALEFVQAQLGEVGIGVEIVPLAGAALQDVEFAGDYHLSLRENYRGWTNEDPDILRRHFHTNNIPPDATSNPGHVSFPELDALLEEGRSTLDTEARCEIYREVQRFLVDQAVVVPLVHFNTNAGHSTAVNGQLADARGTYRYYHSTWIDQ